MGLLKDRLGTIGLFPDYCSEQRQQVASSAHAYEQSSICKHALFSAVVRLRDVNPVLVSSSAS